MLGVFLPMSMDVHVLFVEILILVGMLGFSLCRWGSPGCRVLTCMAIILQGPRAWRC